MKVSDLLENFDLTSNINKVYFRSITDDITSPYDITTVKAAAQFVDFRISTVRLWSVDFSYIEPLLCIWI